MRDNTPANSFSSDPVFFDRFLGYVLSGMINSENPDDKKVIEFIKAPGRTLNDFLSAFPQYAAMAADFKKRFQDGSATWPDGTYPISDFNHGIFAALADDLAGHGLVSKRQDFAYQFQLRISLFQNFNYYLELLLSRLEAAEAINIKEELGRTETASELTELLENSLGLKPGQLFDDFRALAKRK